jgi:hypothetical protein
MTHLNIGVHLEGFVGLMFAFRAYHAPCCAPVDPCSTACALQHRPAKSQSLSSGIEGCISEGAPFRNCEAAVKQWLEYSSSHVLGAVFS